MERRPGIQADGLKKEDKGLRKRPERRAQAERRRGSRGLGELEGCALVWVKARANAGVAELPKPAQGDSVFFSIFPFFDKVQ